MSRTIGPIRHVETVAKIGPYVAPRDARRTADADPALNEDQIRALVKSAVSAALGPIGARVKTLEDQMAKTTEAVEAAADPDGTDVNDAMARAAVLAPGAKLPTLDAAPGKGLRAAVTAFKRKALEEAYGKPEGRMVLQSLTGSSAPKISSMNDGAVGILFRSASTLMASGSAGGSSSATAGYVRDDKGQRVRPMTTAELQAINDRHYGRVR